MPEGRGFTPHFGKGWEDVNTGFSVYLLIKFIFLKICQKKFFGYSVMGRAYRCSTRSLISAVRPALNP